jgi:hypothetical protein
VAVGLVALLILVAGSLLLGTARAQAADDPRSNTASGAGAVAKLLTDEGIEISTTEQVDQAVHASAANTTVVVSNPDRLTKSEAAQLLAAPHDRMVLVNPTAAGLRAFGLDVTAETDSAGLLLPGCGDQAAQRAGQIYLGGETSGYRAADAELACYPSETGYAHLRVPTDSGSVDVVAGGLANNALAREGNAAFATALLGSQPQIVWLMSVRTGTDPTGSDQPTLLPRWWEMAVVQAFLALIMLGVWRGRRLGPIMIEPMPVTVRASETVEGHGRLYYKLGARDRAAEALRSGTRERLGRTFGDTQDREALVSAVAARTGRDPRSVGELLFGSPPADDEELTSIAQHLDHLEQEARQL